MKKTILITSFLALAGFASKAQTQSLRIINNTGCTVLYTIYAHDVNSPSCGSLQSNSFSAWPGSSITFTNVGSVNDGACTPAGSGGGWMGGYHCAVATPPLSNAGWDGVEANTAVGIYAVGASSCYSSTSQTGGDCNRFVIPGSSFYEDWTSTPGQITVTFHN